MLHWHRSIRIIAPVSVNTPEGYVDGLVQDCSNSIANALELLQSGTKPSMCKPIDS